MNYLMQCEAQLLLRCHLDVVQQANRIEWNKRRKLQTDELDFPRPKHKYCWARRFVSEHDSKSDDKLMVKSETYGLASAMLDDDTSEPRSSRGSNSFSEDSDTAISVNEESKLLIDCAKPYLYGRPSHDDDDIEGLTNIEEKSVALGIYTDHVYSEYVKDGTENSIDKEFEDLFTTYGVNPIMYILSSGNGR